jgi:AsmA protein
METTRLVGLRVNLARDESGRTNWDDLAGEGKDKDGKPRHDGEHRGDAMAGLAIGGIEISDAALSWDDRMEGKRYAVKDLALTTGPIAPGQPVDLALGFDVDVKEPEARGRVALSSKLTMDHASHRMRAEGTELKLDLEGAGLPGGALDATLTADIDADMANQTATVANLVLATLGIEATGNVSAKQFRDAPTVNGQLAVAEFELATLVDKLGIELPEGVQAEKLGRASLDTTFSATRENADVQKLRVAIAGGEVTASARVANLADPTASGKLAIKGLNPRILIAASGTALETADPSALSRLDLDSGFTASRGHAELKGLALGLDDSKLTGSASVRDFAKPAIRFGLDLDTIDADRYLPPPKEAPPPATPGAAAPAAAQLVLRLTAKNGQLRLNPARAEMYDGRYKGNIGLDVRGDTPKLSLDESLNGVQVGPLLRDMTGKEEKLTGRAQMSARLTATGSAPEAIQKTLNGNASFAFTDGAVKGVNLAGLIRDAHAKLRGQPGSGGDAPQQTDFASLSGTAKITNGVIDNRDLALKSPVFRVAGAGTADLPKQAVDYLVKASIVGSLQGQGGQEISELKGVTIPVRIKGSLTDPGYSVDVASLATEQVKQKAAEELDKQLQKQLGGESGDGSSGDALKKGLKGLFGN